MWNLQVVLSSTRHVKIKDKRKQTTENEPRENVGFVSQNNNFGTSLRQPQYFSI